MYPLVDKKLWPLFEEFEAEAKKRGQIVNLATQKIPATIETIPAPNVGLCNRETNGRTIIIDQNFWASSSQLRKELIVFHELST